MAVQAPVLVWYLAGAREITGWDQEGCGAPGGYAVWGLDTAWGDGGIAVLYEGRWDIWPYNPDNYYDTYGELYDYI